MYEENTMNGITSQSDDQSGESFYDADPRELDIKIAELTQKIEALEGEKHDLVRENEETAEKVNKLNVVIEVMKTDEAAAKEKMGEMETELLSEVDKQTLEAIAARALELEAEVGRLQNELISAMNETDEINKDVMELKRVVGEKAEKVLGLEREVEELKSAKADNEKRVRELERKIMVLEVRESEAKSEKVRIKEEMREKIDEKDLDILGFKMKIEKLESVIVKNDFNIEKLKKEKIGVEEALRVSEEKTTNLELNMVRLQKDIEKAEHVIGGVKERTLETINGTLNANKDIKDGSKLQLPVVAIGSTGAIVAAAAVIYVFYGRRQ